MKYIEVIMRSSHILSLCALFLVAGCDAIGGGETVIQGNDNLMVTDDVVDRVAATLAGFETTPEVTDEDLQTMYATIRESALGGDLRASLVMLKVAEIQRRPEEPEE